MLTLCILLIGLLMGACSSISPLYEEPDYSTPEKTLLTYYNAFQNKDLQREYECFSDTIKKEFNFGLSIYQEFRTLFEEETSWLTLRIVNHLDMKEHILDQGQTEDQAWIKLKVGGQEIMICFIRKTGFRLEDFDGYILDDLTLPIQELAHIKNNKLCIEIPLLSKRQIKTVREKLPKLGEVRIDSQWKILDLPFLKKVLTTN